MHPTIDGALIDQAATFGQPFTDLGVTETVAYIPADSKSNDVVWEGATATGAPDSKARVWSVSSGALLATLTGHVDSLYGIGFSPDGRRLTTASADGTARIWDTDAGEQLAILRGHSGVVSSAAFSPDGTRIATGALDGTVKVWDASNGTELRSISGYPEGDFWTVAFASNGRRLYVGGGAAVRSLVMPIDELMAVVRARLTRSWTLDECQRFLHQDQCPSAS